MGGLARICKMYGSIKGESNGKIIVWLWDYVNDKSRLESEMTKEEIKESEIKRWELFKEQYKTE